MSAVSAPTGTFVGGKRGRAAVGAHRDRRRQRLPHGQQHRAAVLRRLRDPARPAARGRRARTARRCSSTGTAQINRDSVDAITSRLPLVLGLIAVITFGLLFLLTGSVVLPLKALVLNVLSLTAAFGALVWIFQDGHLGALGTTPTGTLVANMPVLLFCIAFGLSMDYEVFLVVADPRVLAGVVAREPRWRDNDESVALGLARTGRVVTAAALVMSISFAALIASHVSFMRMFGLGLTLAVLVDATLVRMCWCPPSCTCSGGANWWAPKPLTALHNRIGITESPNRRAHSPRTRGG